MASSPDVADVEEPIAFPVATGANVTEAFVLRKLTHADPDGAEIHVDISPGTRYVPIG